MKPKRPILLALDGDEAVQRAIATAAAPYFETMTTRDPRRFLGWVHAYAETAAVVSEHVLESASGIDMLDQARALRPSARRVLLTTYHDLASIVGGIHSGAIECLLAKPFTAVELISALIPDQSRRVAV